MFEEIYENANIASLKNSKIIEEERKQQEVWVNEEDRIHEEVEGAKWEIMDTMPDPSYVFSTELLDIVKKLGVTLIEYGKRVDTVNFYYENNSTIEYYSVKNNKYKFVIKNLTDCDIDDGIFAVYYVIDLQTNE